MAEPRGGGVGNLDMSRRTPRGSLPSGLPVTISRSALKYSILILALKGKAFNNNANTAFGDFRLTRV